MKADQKEYSCGVCNEYSFKNIKISIDFKYPNRLSQNKKHVYKSNDIHPI